ncbi:Putative LOC100377198, partial [Caligus rogercresseyi]
MSPRGRSAKSVLVTGCDSGAGLEVVKALAQQAEGQSNLAVIIAAAKNPNNSELSQDCSMDLEDQKNFGNFAAEVQKRLNEAGVQHLSALVNSAALHFNTNLSNVDAGHMIKAFSVNAVSPLMLIKALSKQLQSGAQAAGSAAASGAPAGADAMLYSSSKASHAAAEMGGPADAMNAATYGAGTYGAAHAGSLHGAKGLHAGMGAGAGHAAGAAAAAAFGAGATLGAEALAGAGSGSSSGVRFGVGGPNSGAILVGSAGAAFAGNGGGLVVNLTTGLSSTGANSSGGFYAYRASKAALNMITKSAAADLASSGVMAFSLNIDNAALDSQSSAAG